MLPLMIKCVADSSGRPNSDDGKSSYTFTWFLICTDKQLQSYHVFHVRLA